MSRKSGFTLAEVLITLGIIGVVAAMTLPVLIAKYEKMVALNQLKRSYAIIQNALLQMRADNDGQQLAEMAFVHQQWDHSDHFDLNMFIPEFTKYLKVIKHGKFANQSRIAFCQPEGIEKKYYVKTEEWTTFYTGNLTYAWQLEDGSCIAIRDNGGWTWSSSDEGIRIYVDVNGSFKGPNMMRKDVFVFRLDPPGVLRPYRNLSNQVCTNKEHWGFDCAAKIIDDGWQIKNDYPW